MKSYNGIKTGDLITTYYMGYYELIELKYSEQNIPLALFKIKFNSKGKPINSNKILQCDAGFCRKALDSIQKEIDNKREEIKSLQNILNNNIR